MFKADSTQLCFGKYGMKSCKAGRISYQAIEVAHCIISKRISKKWSNMGKSFRRYSYY